jgi:uncharacterized Zn finger protein
MKVKLDDLVKLLISDKARSLTEYVELYKTTRQQVLDNMDLYFKTVQIEITDIQ